MFRPAVFLDRDGTLNAPVVRDGKPFPPATVDEFVLMDGVVQACQQLKQAGFVLVVATNQPDVGRGTQSRQVVEAMHAKLCALAPIDRVEVSYSPGAETPPDPDLKSEAGILLRAARELKLDLSRSWMVGDRWRDVDCGFKAGVRTVFIDWGYDEKLRAQPDFTVRSFSDAVGIILAQLTSRN